MESHSIRYASDTAISLVSQALDHFKFIINVVFQVANENSETGLVDFEHPDTSFRKVKEKEMKYEFITVNLSSKLRLLIGRHPVYSRAYTGIFTDRFEKETERTKKRTKEKKKEKKYQK